eukprot:Clim_evm3s41 gene=Clim_evmTU3s41
MCGRYALPLAPEDIAKKTQTNPDHWKKKDRFRSGYNIGPGRAQPVMRTPGRHIHKQGSAPKQHKPADHDNKNDQKVDERQKNYELKVKAEQEIDDMVGENHSEKFLQTMQWGLVPPWQKEKPDWPTIARAINARAETLEERNMFKIVLNKRCAIPVQCFFEWQQQGKEKVPYMITSDAQQKNTGGLMYFAGLYSSYIDKTDEEDPVKYTFTVITTEASKPMSWLHDRMPVILNTQEEINEWVDSSKDFSEVKHLLKGSTDLKFQEVSQVVNNMKNDSPDCVKPRKVNKITSFFSPKKKRTATEADIKKEDDMKSTPPKLVKKT